MTPAQNKKLMQDIFAGVAKGDPSMYVEHMAEDIIATVTGANSWSQTFSGKDNVRRNLYGYVNSLLAERRTIPLRFLADEDWVVIEARGENRTKQQVRYDNEYCLLYRLRDGMIVEVREYLDSMLCEQVLGPYPADLPAKGSRSCLPMPARLAWVAST